ncbi:hypothetical protein LWI29_011566 [Acer saccharum]|uniref:RRM domain-containing protein n=1 Tax=Acer saccharum TaxID=4024 RepID=A0AA39SPK9_ACESA|nr:hypothetical protein LWI29_011566 [Acer saccharum]
MREKGRERGSGYARAGEAREGNTQGRGHGRYEDFRDKLFSIHVDNINPVLDQMGLWSIFKPFGRVRDVYLSPRNSSRGSLYAFVRFETLEEAKKVATMTNGMHVYGWPIVAKLATFGWKRRRNAAEGFRYRTATNDKETKKEEETLDPGMQGKKSYAEIVKQIKGYRIGSF